MLKEKPFGILPDKEREMALGLQKSIEKKNSDAALKQLEELTNSLGERLKAEIRSSRRTKMWTVIGAIAGILGLVITVTILILR